MLENDPGHESQNCCRIVSKLGKADSLGLLKKFKHNFHGMEFDSSSDAEVKLDDGIEDYKISDQKMASHNLLQSQQVVDNPVEMV